MVPAVKLVKTMPESGWTPIGNDAARGRAITQRARGLLVQLLSYPADNGITLAKIVERGPKDPVTGRLLEGREALQTAMRELERAGYVVHDRRRDGRGRWSSTVYVCADPDVLAGQLRQSPGPYSVGPSSAEPQSVGPRSVGTSSTTCKTDWKEAGGKTDAKDGGLQHSSALAAARAGRASGQANDHADLGALYDAANRLDADRLRRLLLAFEKKRPRIYRECRQAALGHLDREDAAIVRGPDGVRSTDLLSYKYALQHYADKGLPAWLTRFPRAAAA